MHKICLRFAPAQGVSRVSALKTDYYHISPVSTRGAVGAAASKNKKISRTKARRSRSVARYQGKIQRLRLNRAELEARKSAWGKPVDVSRLASEHGLLSWLADVSWQSLCLVRKTVRNDGEQLGKYSEGQCAPMVIPEEPLRKENDHLGNRRAVQAA
ncbi:hypothetical protein B0H17DRAFT_1150632 [Mycena rosella]|uniref:Uncharacterized protein n=1 Tax=Mycena rosella TaxID=1033263 RepID=A0AAD7BSM9_MYCRO|nr:hypothetical protein B0H17DRAFT_1150632 [Mycena rosella]